MLRKVLDSPWLYFSLAGLLLVVALLSQFELKLPSRPVGGLEELRALRQRDDVNVVFILIDTLRADHLGAYGYERDTSPVMDLLASAGARFAHVESQSSWTKASMASLWTGFYPERTGVTRYPDAVSPDAVMPAEIFQEAGFRTAGIFRNGWVENNFGFSQGFDLYIKPQPSQTPVKFETRNPSSHPLQGTDFDATDSAEEFIRSHAKDRFFLYVHYMDVHQYLCDIESSKFGTSLPDAYDNAIHWTDRNVSSLVAQLDAHDLLDKTLIVIASDHGEAFYEHGIEGHARNLYREVTETPLMLFFPFRLEPGVVVQSRVQNVDIWPTVLDLLGLPPLPDPDGRSLVPLLEAAMGAPSDGIDGLLDRASLAQLDQTWGRTGADPKPITAIVQGDYRLIHHTKAPKQPELYDRRIDPREQTNLAEERAELAQRLVEHFEAVQAKPRPFEAPEVHLDEMRINQLRALGYLQNLDK